MTPVTELLLKYMDSHPETFDRGAAKLTNTAYNFLETLLRDQPDEFGIPPYLPEEERNLIRDKLRGLRLDGLHKQLMQHITNDGFLATNEYGKRDTVTFKQPAPLLKAGHVMDVLPGNEMDGAVYQKHATLMHNGLTENLKQQAAIMLTELKTKVKK